MKTIVFIILTFLNIHLTTAQITNAELQAAGLTCSMCSKAIHQSIAKLGFVEKIESNIKTSTYVIMFKNNSGIDIDALQKAVTAAGFSVAKLIITLNSPETAIEKDAHIPIDGKMYHIVKSSIKKMNGLVKLQIIDKNFVTASQFKQYSKLTSMACYQTGFMQNCCSVKEQSNQRIYHAEIVAAL